MPERVGAQPLALSATEGHAVWFNGNRMTIKATAADTGGTYGLVEGLVPPGGSPPTHVHSREEEAFWVLEGCLAVRCGERTFSAAAGSFTLLPRDLPHSFVAEGARPVRMLTVCSPGGFERFFVEAGRPAESDGLPPATAPDIALLRRVGADFGVEIVGPPMARLPSQGAEIRT